MTDTVIVVPCFNEAKRLQPEAFHEHVRRDPAVSFVMVDDGSRDGTLPMLDAMHDEMPERIDTLALQPNGGKAEAVRCGMLRALDRGAEQVGFWDADLATPLDAIASFRRVLDDRPHVTVVMGSRVKLLGRHIERNEARHYLGRMFATAASMALRLPVYDTQCGAKLFRRTPELRSYFADPFLTRWIFDVEILARAMRTPAMRADIVGNERVYELPLDRWTDVAGSKLKPTDFLKAIQELARIRWKYRP